jgi:hypothetical protein
VDPRRALDLVTAATLGGILAALALVLATRTGACSAVEAAPDPAQGPTPVVRDEAQFDAADIEQLVEQAVQRERVARRQEQRDWVPDSCRMGELPYGVCMDLGFPPRAEICKDSRTSAAERAALRCHEFDR